MAVPLRFKDWTGRAESAVKRQTNRELEAVRNRELELKRITGEISCAECRRLKLKCDKKVPCSSCVRRGCQDICPTGTVPGNIRHHRVASDQVHQVKEADRTQQLVERIIALEDALHIQCGDSSHPLLSPEFLAIKQGTEQTSGDRSEEKDEHLVSAFGTLSVTDGQTTSFLGASAADNILLMELFNPDTHPRFINSDLLPRELVHASKMWPFVPAYLAHSGYITQLVLQLPSYERANSLMEAYFLNMIWLWGPISRSQLAEEVVPLFYPDRKRISPEMINTEKLQDLALLFSVLACGAATDLTQPATNPEAERFNRLARAALGMRSFLDHPSLATCQTLFLLATYEGSSGKKTSLEGSYNMSSIGLTVAASIGLHLDPSRWNIEPRLANWRRRAFWEINSTEKWRSLASGRPWAFPRDTIDCEFPIDNGATIGEDGNVIESVWQWKYRFVRDVLSVLAERICTARPRKYSDMMEMDRLIRAFDVHPFVSNPPKHPFTFATDGEFRSLPPHMTVWHKEMAVLYVHRNYFARAMLEYPADPTRCPFSPSLFATYKSATIILTLLRAAVGPLPLITERLWGAWAVSLNCAVIIGTIASLVSGDRLAESARKELGKAIGLFETGSSNPIAQSGLKLLYHLREKADKAYRARNSQSRQGTREASPSDLEERDGRHPTLSPPFSDEILEERLNILGGMTRYVEQRSILSSYRSERSHPIERLAFDNRESPSLASSSLTTLGSSSTNSSNPSPGSLSKTTVTREINVPNQFPPAPRDFANCSSRDDTNRRHSPQHDSTFEYDDYFRHFTEPSDLFSGHSSGVQPTESVGTPFTANSSTSQPFAPLDPILGLANVMEENFSGSLPQPSDMANFDALFHDEPGDGSDAWNSFMRQFQFATPE